MDVSIEALFERFRSTGDPDALAAIYDRVAVQLLRLAIHLTHDQAQSEDLLQATFVAAIQSAPAFDGSRPLLPWLMGILGKQAHKLRVLERREAAPPRTAPAPVVDPHAEAEVEELSRALDDAIERLPEVHRPVLVLKLKHGLTPGEIGNALGRSPGTVRVQLHRGLEQLRALLPVGFALSALLVITPTRGLAAVREAVLAARPVPVTPAAASLVGIGGILLMKKLLLSAAAVAAACVLTYVLWKPSHSSVPSESHAGAAANAAPRASGEREPELPPAAEPATASRRAVASAPAAPAPSDHAVIKGRCVAAESGAPLTAGLARLHGFATPEARSSELAPWRPPEPAPLDPEGRFVLTFIPPRDRQYMVFVEPEGRVRRIASVKRLEPAAVSDLGEVRFAAGSLVRGIVREEEGKPVASVRITVNYPNERIADPSMTEDAASALTDDVGRFRFSWLPPGSHALTLPQECSLVSPQRLVVPADSAETVVEVTVKLAPIAGKVSGTVLDDAGRPLAGASVSVSRLGVMQVPIGHVRTGPDGAFELTCRGVGFDRVAVSASSGVLTDPAPEREVSLNDTVTIRMVRMLGLRITVRAADTGAPIEEFEITLLPRDQRRTIPIGERHGERHSGGVLVVTGQLPGNYALRVLPKDRKRWRPSKELPVVIRPGEEANVTVDLKSPVELTVALRFASGAPVPGSRAQLIRIGLSDYQIERMEDIGKEGQVFTSGGGTTVVPTVVLDEAETDARGEVRLGAPLDEQKLAVRALGPGHVPVVQRGVSLVPGGAPVQITVQRGAILEARLTPVTVLGQLDYAKEQRERGAPGSPSRQMFERFRPGLALRRVGESNPDLWLPNDSTAFPADASGVVRATGMPPGRFEVFLRWWDAKHRKTWSPAPIAVVTFEDDRTTTLEADIGSLAPAALSGTVLLDGTPLVTEEIVLQPGGASVRTDAAGRFAVARSNAGRYRAAVVRGDGKTEPQVTLVSDEEIEVQSGKAAEVTFRVRTRTLRLRVLDSDGKPPPAGTKLALTGKASAFGRFVRTDAEGMVVLPVVAHGAIVVRLVPPEAEDKVQETQHGIMGYVGLLRAVGTVEIPINQTEVSATLRLP